MSTVKEQFSITRTFKASKQQVFDAFANAEALTKWWGPAKMPIDVLQLDFRPQGIFHYSMKAGEVLRYGVFHYVTIEEPNRKRKLNQLEELSARQQSTQIFIETPYRNNQLLETILKTCKPQTRICIAANLTAANEVIQTKTVAEWKKQIPDLHKIPVIFCLMG